MANVTDLADWCASYEVVAAATEVVVAMAPAVAVAPLLFNVAVVLLLYKLGLLERILVISG